MGMNSLHPLWRLSRYLITLQIISGRLRFSTAGRRMFWIRSRTITLYNQHTVLFLRLASYAITALPSAFCERIYRFQPCIKWEGGRGWCLVIDSHIERGDVTWDITYQIPPPQFRMRMVSWLNKIQVSFSSRSWVFTIHSLVGVTIILLPSEGHCLK
jgi:hypothetical protein